MIEQALADDAAHAQTNALRSRFGPCQFLHDGSQSCRQWLAHALDDAVEHGSRLSHFAGHQLPVPCGSAFVQHTKEKRSDECMQPLLGWRGFIQAEIGWILLDRDIRPVLQHRRIETLLVPKMVAARGDFGLGALADSAQGGLAEAVFGEPLPRRFEEAPLRLNAVIKNRHLISNVCLNRTFRRSDGLCHEESAPRGQAHWNFLARASGERIKGRGLPLSTGSWVASLLFGAHWDHEPSKVHSRAVQRGRGAVE